jgi:hypothetical protein
MYRTAAGALDANKHRVEVRTPTPESMQQWRPVEHMRSLSVALL